MENQKQDKQGVDEEVPNQERNQGAWNGHLDSEESLPTDGPVSKNDGDNGTDLSDIDETPNSNVNADQTASTTTRANNE